MFPVPLNSWKITSSIRLPVSTRAVARMVRLPEPSQLRAAPKNCRGNCRARLSTPPDMVRPPGPISRLLARPRRVSESSRMTTCWPDSTRRLARSMARRASLMWESAAESDELASTSAGTARRKCVTSSGRSSMSSRMRCISGWCLAMALPRCSSSVVLPALGGETMRPRWPRPMGAIRSMTRRLVSACSAASWNGSSRVDGREVLEVGEGPVLLGSQTRRFVNLDYDTTTAATRHEQRPSISVPSRNAKSRAIRDRNDDVVAERQVVLCDLPKEPAGAFRELHDAVHRRASARSSESGLGGGPSALFGPCCGWGPLGPF